ncbi:hypothetical protein AB0H00_11185 [Nocardia sp. NPDC023852]|uniref:hypothetical protein n=1 Tax=Nocardia sp. NPDC023852 TaxID=3154697 RepID=UPI0033FF8C8C
MSENTDFDGRAIAALSTEAGIEWDEAERLVAILRKAGVLRSANVRNDIADIPAYSNLFLSASGDSSSSV